MQQSYNTAIYAFADNTKIISYYSDIYIHLLKVYTIPTYTHTHMYYIIHSYYIHILYYIT